MRNLVLIFAFLVAGLVSSSVYAQEGEPGARVFYNPFPLRYDRELVKVIDGLMPGRSTLRDAVDTYGPPSLISCERWFYWEWRTRDGLKQVKMDFFAPAQKYKRQYDYEGFDGRAVIKEIIVADTARTAYSTYMQDLIDFTQYPYQILFHSRENRYEMQFYEQGYSMFFDGDTQMYIHESYFPHEDLVLRGVYYLHVGTGDLVYTQDVYLP